MTKIERIKVGMRSVKMGERMSYPFGHITPLVEYFEASEAEFKYVGTSGDTATYRRLRKARAALEKEEYTFPREVNNSADLLW